MNAAELVMLEELTDKLIPHVRKLAAGASSNGKVQRKFLAFSLSLLLAYVAQDFKMVSDISGKLCSIDGPAGRAVIGKIVDLLNGDENKEEEIRWN